MHHANESFDRSDRTKDSRVIQDHIYIFVVCPNSSGSTLIAKFLSSSQNVSVLPSINHEGQWAVQEHAPGAMPLPKGNEVKNWTSNFEKFANPSNYDWSQIKYVWHSLWDNSKKLFLEKSPPNVITAPMLEKQFDNSRFVLSMRDPYAFCEGVRRARGYGLEVIATHWLRCAELQLRNRQSLKNSYCFSYEELCDESNRVVDELLRFIPELEHLETEREYSVQQHHGRMINKNPEQIARLSSHDTQLISQVLSRDKELVEQFGYDLL